MRDGVVLHHKASRASLPGRGMAQGGHHSRDRLYICKLQIIINKGTGVSNASLT